MTHSVLSHRLAAGTAAVALAFSAAALIPTVQAQAPVPPAPVTAGDAKEYEAADALFMEGKYQEAMVAFEKFTTKYKMLSPRSIDAHFRLALCYLQQKPKPMTSEAVAILRKLMENPKFEPAGKEQAQLLIAKAFTMQGADMPSQTDPQKAAQVKVFENAIKEYDTFLTGYPQSKSGDTALFLSGALLLSVEKYEDAIKRFSAVYQRYAQSPLRMSALMNIGKTFMSQGYGLMASKKGKEAPEADVKQGLTILEKNAIPSLTEAYTKSQDLAIMNEAVYYLGQIQLSRSQNVSNADEATAKKEQSTFLNLSLDAFRAVRSREEVIAAQEAKIEALKKAIQMIPPGTPDYMPTKNYYENLIGLETEKKEKFLNEQDQFLGARLAIARIFLFLKKPDECRVLLRYLQGQKDALANEKDATASIAALLSLTYVEQKNLKSAVETYEAFRGANKGHLEGDNLALLIANLYLEANQPDKAEEIIGQGKTDYGPGVPNPQGGAHDGWRFLMDANQILIGAAIQRSDYQKALALCEEVLSSSPKPHVESQILFLKGSVLRGMASEKGDASLADKSLATFQTLRDKFPDDPRSEDAWSEQIAILAGRDPAKAQGEMEKYLQKFSGGGAKSENTKTNLPIVQFRLGQVLDALNKQDDAIKSWQKVVDLYPESEPAPGAFFKMFDIYKERKDYANCKKLMDEFVQKYPKHENVYYAFNNIAEFLFSGVLNAKTGPDGKPLPSGGQPTVADTEEGAKKLNEYVDYELSNNLEKKRGDGSLLRIADRWIERLSKLPPYMTQSKEQQQVWLRANEGVTTAVEKMIKNYPNGEKVSDGLERLVTVQRELLKGQIIDAAKGEAYFRKLANEASTPELKAKLLFALGAFVQESDPKKAASARADGFAAVGGGAGGSTPVFSASDWDRRLSDLFEQKKFEDISKGIAQIRSENKEEEGKEAPIPVQNALSVALFWEAKVLGEQGKAVEAGNLFTLLAKKYSKSTKVLEADYGIILGKVEQGDVNQDDFIPRLTKIVNNVRDVKTFELPAKALFLIGRIQEKQKDYEAAIGTYLKIHTRYASVPSVSGDGLWAGAQLLEGQAKGTIPVRTPKELQAAAQAKAAKAKELKDKEEAAKKKEEGAAKPADSKATDTKDAKAPGVAKTEPAKK